MNQLSVLVVSFDAYSDLWGTFFTLFKRYWSDCPYKVYLGSNHKVFEGVETITIGDDISWCDNLRRFLDRIETPYVLLLLDDFFFDKKVDNQRIRELFEYMKANNVDCMRLRPSPIAARTIDRKLDIGLAEPGSPYFINSQSAIWKKEVLFNFLKPGKNIWQFELENSRNSVEFSSDLYKICTSNRSDISFHNGVERGKYYSETIRFLKSEGLEVDPSHRGIINDSGVGYKIRRKISKTKMFVFIKLRLYRSKYRNILLKNI